MSGYIGVQPVPQATQTRDAFIATSGQTSFATAGYQENFLDVYLNGVKLAAADYTASNGSDVVLAVGAATSDILEVVAFSTFNILNSTNSTTFGGQAPAYYTDLIAAKLPLAGGAMTGAITTSSTFDGRDVAVDGAKLDNIEVNATADQTAAQIKAAYEGQTSAFTDAQFTKLSNIEVNATTDQTAQQLLDAVKTVDGTGSGLDADLLDGQEASYFTGYVDTAINNLVNGAPDALNTLDELAAALGDSAAFSTTVTNSIAAKVSKTSSTGAASIPAGTTAQRDGSPVTGALRFNSTDTSFEGYNGSAWGSIGGGASGGGSDAVFYENDQAVTANFTIASNKNAMSTGPVTVNSGVTVTVSGGARYVVI